MEESLQLTNLNDSLISVVIPVYNRATTILRAINSALNQTLPPFEVLVIDDGSRDGTPDILNALHDQRIRVIHMACNMGAQRARLKGIDKARGEFLVFLDSDDELLPDSIERRLLALQRSGWSEALVYGDIIRGGMIDKYEFLRGHSYPYLLKELSLCPYSAMLIPKRCLTFAGFPEPDLPSWQDDDMVLTIGKHFPVLHCGAPVAFMNPQTSSISNNKRAVVEGCRKMVAKYSEDILATHGPFRLLLWRLRIVRSGLIARCFDKKIALERHFSLFDSLQLLYLIFCRITLRILLAPFFRHIYG